jgi:4-aminobutyrate aminotransferase-like enzyme
MHALAHTICLQHTMVVEIDWVSVVKARKARLGEVDVRQLIADKFCSDPRVLEAKKVLLDVLSEHSAAFTEVRDPDPDLKVQYDDLLNQFGKIRGASLFFPYLGCLDAALRDTVMQGNLQQNTESADLAQILLTAANRKGACLKHCFFSTSGAMANENALKIIFQRKHPANRLLAFEGCFMGRTLALSQITDKPAYRDGLPPTLAVDYLPFFDPAQPEESRNYAVDRLMRLLARYPGQYAAMALELVQGEGGFYPGETGFFKALMEACRENGLAVLVDEIQTFGRTTELFAFQHYGLDKLVDVATIGKLTQVCATLFIEDFKPKPGLLSQTFTGSSSAIAAARVIVRELLEGDFFGPGGRISRFHNHFVKRLREIDEHHPGLITGPFGIGAMIAFTPFGGDPEKVRRFIYELFDAGVVSFYAGSEPTRVRFLIPVGAVTFEDIDAVASIVESILLKIAD